MSHIPLNGQSSPEASLADPSPPLECGKPVTEPDVGTGTPLKRKHYVDKLELGREKRQRTKTPEEHNAKERRPSLHTRFPGEVWQHIFSFLPPRSLPLLLRTCRAFHKYLTDTSLDASICTTPRGLCTVHPDLIWRASRTRWLPAIPPMLPGISEPKLFQFLGRNDCQFCGKVSASLSRSRTWTPGPGSDGVRHVWHFNIRSCGHCLTQRVKDDRSLMFSEFSALLSVAPFLFLTNQDHVLSPSAFRSAGEIPKGIEVQKVFLISQLESLQSQASAARDRDPQEARALIDTLAYELTALTETFDAWDGWATKDNIARFTSWSTISPHEAARDLSEAEACLGGTVNLEAVKTPTPDDTGLHRPPTRTKAGASEAKASRRAEIERRCSELEPSLDKTLLEYMDAFGAAMQISMPLTEGAWELLKPKLIAQRDTAQQRYNEQKVARQALQQSNDDGGLNNDVEKIRERWEAFQKPIRADLERHVDELVRTSWADGRAINRNTASRFATDALVFARNRYAAEKPKNMQPGSAFRLVLHNMKWLYENKLRPLIEAANGSLELFRCSECGQNSKTFAFESLIQHYGAKHAKEFNTGGTGIAWFEAPWPQRSPFQIITEGSGLYASQPELPSTIGDIWTSGDPSKAYSEPNTLYQPIASAYRPPLASPGFSPDAYFGGLSTPSLGYPSVATSPAYSAGRGYLPLGHFGDVGATSPFEDIHGYSVPYFNPRTPVQAQPNPGSWSASANYSTSTHPPHMPSPAPTQPSLYQMQSAAVASIAKGVWDLLSPVKQIPPSVRCYVLIHHTVSRFKERFSNVPNIDLFAQCVNEHALLRSLKNANGLACKVCVLEKESREEGHAHAFPLTGGERKLYSFSTLLSHFKQVHVETRLALENAHTHDNPDDLQRLDWREDMIELPEDSLIEGLKHLPGMGDAQRVSIFKEAFPPLFVDVAAVSSNPPPPHVEDMQPPGPMAPPDPRYRSETSNTLATQGFIKIEPDDPYATTFTYPAPTLLRPDQYDPSRPSISTRMRGSRSYHVQPRRGSVNAGRRGAHSASTDRIPGDLLRSLTSPVVQPHYENTFANPHQMIPSQPPVVPSYPDPYIQPPYQRAAAQYGYAPSPGFDYEADENVEYVYVQRKGPREYGP